MALDRDLGARRLIARRKSFRGGLAAAAWIEKHEDKLAPRRERGGIELSTPGYFSLGGRWPLTLSCAIAEENFGERARCTRRVC